MKLTRVCIIKAATCGGLLDNLNVPLRGTPSDIDQFSPLCLVGPNGAGKSQFLQVIAEAFQSVFHACVPNEERTQSNEELEFAIEYLIRPNGNGPPVPVRISRCRSGRRLVLKVERSENQEWVECTLGTAKTSELLPSRIIGYTSGNNETLSLPFLVSRGGYADAVREQAWKRGPNVYKGPIPDTRLMHIDYGTHLEVLVANLLLGTAIERQALLAEARLAELHSFRCVIQLAHPAVSRIHRRGSSERKGVQLTDELERYIHQLKCCSTAHSYDEKLEIYVFDFLVTDATRAAFRSFWKTTLELYSALHKLSMLNDIVIPKPARKRLQRDIKTRRFASRLPEPQDEDRVFRFEQVRFLPTAGKGVVDYVSLSDGEHQLAQILGTMCMASYANVLFLLDEPESHFNPQWRVKFISRENVLIFKKSGSTVKAEPPNIETFGTTFDTILEECFAVRPPMSEMPQREIERLRASKDVEAIKAGIAKLGDSVDKVFLMDHLRQLSKREGA